MQRGCTLRYMNAPSEARNLTWLRSIESATVSIEDVAELLDVDRRTVTRACEDGQLPSVRVGRRVLIPRVPLLALLDAPAATAGPAAGNP